MIEIPRRYSRGAQLASLAMSTLLALWLLVRPEIISSLPLAGRLPIWGLGVWAVGAGFAHGMGLAEKGRARRLLGPPLCWVLLSMLALVLVLRAVV